MGRGASLPCFLGIDCDMVRSMNAKTIDDIEFLKRVLETAHRDLIDTHARLEGDPAVRLVGIAQKHLGQVVDALEAALAVGNGTQGRLFEGL